MEKLEAWDETVEALKRELGKIGIDPTQKVNEPHIVNVREGKLGRFDPRICDYAIPSQDGKTVRLWINKSITAIGYKHKIMDVIPKMEALGYEVIARDRKGEILHQSPRS